MHVNMDRCLHTLSELICSASFEQRPSAILPLSRYNPSIIIRNVATVDIEGSKPKSSFKIFLSPY